MRKSCIHTLLALGFGVPVIAATTPVTTISLGTQPPFVSPVTGVLAPAANRLYVFNGPWLGTSVSNPAIAIIDTSSNALVGKLQPAAIAGMTLVDIADA